MLNSIKFVRQDFTDNSTIGEVLVDGNHQCFYLEPTCRDIPGKIKAIPAGTYEVVMYNSPRFSAMTPPPTWFSWFDKQVPLLLKVPGHDGVLIHPGNTPFDTLDCLLPGYTKAVDFVGESDAAWKDLVTIIVARLALGQLFVEMIGAI